MGGRGGSGPSAPARGAAAEFEWWANTSLPINVDYVGEGRVRLTLPDTGAYLFNDRGTYKVLRDTDDKVLFSNTRGLKGLWNEISSYYGGTVEVSVDPGARAPGARTGLFGAEHGRKSSPAARLYKVK